MKNPKNQRCFEFGEKPILSAPRIQIDYLRKNRTNEIKAREIKRIIFDNYNIKEEEIQIFNFSHNSNKIIEGKSNFVYLLIMKNQKYILKEYNFSNKKYKIMEKLRDMLSKKGVPITQPYKNIKEEVCVFENNNYYELFPYLENEECNLNKKIIMQATQLIKIHHKSTSNEFKGITENVKIPEFDEKIKTFIENKFGKNITTIFNESFKSAKKIIDSNSNLVLVSDFRHHNFIINGGAISSIIDFADIKKIPRVIDLAIFIRDVFEESEKKEIKLIADIIKDYNNTLFLTYEEINALPHIIILDMFKDIQIYKIKEKEGIDLPKMINQKINSIIEMIQIIHERKDEIIYQIGAGIHG